MWSTRLLFTYPVMSGSRIAREKLQELLGILHCAPTETTHRAASKYGIIAACRASTIYINANSKDNTFSISITIHVLSKVMAARVDMPDTDQRRPG